MSRLAKLQLLARQLVEGLATGLHRSPHKGASVAFKQHRPYVPGDEIRRLDWRVFARTDRYYIREYEQETNLQAMLLVDVSGSMNYAGRNATQTKAQYACAIAAGLGRLLIGQQDAVGVLTFDTRIRTFIPPRSRPGHLRVLNEALSREQPGGETAIHTVLRELAPRIGRRNLLVLISDCLDETGPLLRALAQLRHQHHEMLLFHVLDRDELEFPFSGWTRFESLEKDDDQLTTDPASLRRTYFENLAQFQAALKKGCSSNRIGLHPMVTDEPVEPALAAHLTRRLERG